MIIRKVGKSQLGHVRSRDPYVIWETLSKVHRARGLATRLTLRRRFYSSKKGEGESMQAYISRVRSMAWDLDECGVKVEDEDLVVALTVGLDKTYELFVISLESTPENIFTSDYVVTRMLNKEVRRNAAKEDDGIAEAKVKEEEKDEGVENNVLSSLKDVQCYNCKKFGHIRSQCKAKKRKGNSDSQDSSDDSRHQANTTTAAAAKSHAF